MSDEDKHYTWDEQVAVDQFQEIDPEDPKNWFRAPPPRPTGLCSKVKEAMLNCLKETDCYKKHGYTPRECLDLARPGTNPQCEIFTTALAKCKFDMIDRKRRFRGVRGVNNIKATESDDRL